MTRLNWTARCVVRSPYGFVLVRSKRPNSLWKFPGGGKNFQDTDPIDTIIREICEETGILVSRSKIKLIAAQRVTDRVDPKKTHMVYYGLLYIDVTDIPWVRTSPFEDEEARHFTDEEILCEENLLPQNKEFLIAKNLWPSESARLLPE